MNGLVILTLVAAGGNLAGAVLLVRGARGRLLLAENTLAFGAGFMLAVVVIGIFPVVLRSDATVASVEVLAGYLVAHLLRTWLAPHQHAPIETHTLARSAGVNATIGLSLHAVFDGVALASAIAANGWSLGLLLVAAIVLHKIPEGMTVASIVLASGFSERAALRAAGLLGVGTILGAALATMAAPLAVHGLAVAAGPMLYASASELLPASREAHGWSHLGAFSAGAGLIVLLRFVLFSSFG